MIPVGSTPPAFYPQDPAVPSQAWASAANGFQTLSDQLVSLAVKLSTRQRCMKALGWQEVTP